MPVIATPAATPRTLCCEETPYGGELATVPCDGQNIVSTTATTVRGQPVLNKMRAISLRGGSEAVIEWTMHDRDGNPVDLSGCVETCAASASSAAAQVPEVGEIAAPLLSSSEPVSSESLGLPCKEPYAIRFRIREALSLGCSPVPCRMEYPARVIDAENGRVRVTLPRTATNTPGVYFGEMALVRTDATPEPVMFSNTFYVYIDRALWSAKGPKGPPSIAEIRLHLRDSGGAENFLLDNVKFDDAEIALAVQRPVQYWNEVPPPIETYSTQNFPFRYHWLEGICANLFLMVAEHFRANNLQYQAAGVAVNDQDKMGVYEEAAARRNAAFQSFVRAKKVEMNIAKCYGGIGSPYENCGYSCLSRSYTAPASAARCG